MPDVGKGRVEVDEVASYMVAIPRQSLSAGEYACHNPLSQCMVVVAELCPVLLVARLHVLRVVVLHGVLPVGRNHAVEGEA